MEVLLDEYGSYGGGGAGGISQDVYNLWYDGKENSSSGDRSRD